MAEFDSNGFLAVDKFFGEQQQQEKKEGKQQQHDVVGAMLKSPAQRRGGVGAVTAKKTGILKFENVLLVGKKNKNSKRPLQEMDDDHSVPPVPGVDDDLDDEFDVSRTAIAKDTGITKKSKNITVEDGISIHKSSKKAKRKSKLGKKERLNQREKADAAEQSSSLPEDSATPLERVEATTEKTASTDNDPSTSATKNNKCKRRKVRSRQKNIRKDTRSIADKPAHLIPGNPKYQGRPLTQATKERLKHPVTTGKRILVKDIHSTRRTTIKDTHSTTRTTITAKSNHHSNQDAFGELFVIDRNSVDDVGVMLYGSHSSEI